MVFRTAAFSGFGGRSVSAPIELARALVFGAQAYADRFRFRPHPDFEKARPLLGEGSVEEGIRFGRGGSPFTVSKLDDVDDLEIDEHDWNDKQADLALAQAMKMYILIKESVPVGHAIVAAAHASLKMYLEFEREPEIAAWLSGPFFKVICRVSDADFERAKEAGDFAILTESKLDDEEIALAFKPRAEWPRSFQFFQLYR